MDSRQSFAVFLSDDKGLYMCRILIVAPFHIIKQPVPRGSGAIGKRKSPSTSIMEDSALSFFIICGLVSLLYYQHRLRMRLGKLPPGPMELPILGNFLEMTDDVWLKFTDWKRSHGELT